MAKISMTMGQIQGFQWPWSNFLTIDHGSNSRVSWSLSVPYPPPPLVSQTSGPATPVIDISYPVKEATAILAKLPAWEGDNYGGS